MKWFLNYSFYLNLRFFLGLVVIAFMVMDEVYYVGYILGVYLLAIIMSLVTEKYNYPSQKQEYQEWDGYDDPIN